MLEQVRKAVENGRQKKVEELVRGALEAGAGPGEILDAMEQAMGAVGERFQSGELFIPEVLVAAKTMQKGVEVLRPLLARGDTGKYGKFIIGTARGDLHEIGKNLVALMAESAGFEIVDLGVDVPPERFVEAVRAHPDCRVVGISALLTTTMEAMRETVQALEAAGLRGQARIMVGGAPVTEEYARQIGADAYTDNAGAAAAKAKELAAS